MSRKSKKLSQQDNELITDALSSDPAALEANVGPGGKVLIAALDRAVAMQSSLISNYITRLRRRHPQDSPAQLQRRVDKHFMRLASGTGAGVGATAAVPGIGFVAATAAVGAESLVFLDAAAFYTMASATLRGADISNPERRRALILVVMLGAKGSAIVDTLVGDVSIEDASKRATTTQLLNRVSLPSLGSLNKTLMQSAVKRIGRRLTRGWFAKILPLGIGAVLGTLANRRLARDLVNNVAASLGAPPAHFERSLEALPEVPAEQAKEIDALDAAGPDGPAAEDGDKSRE